MKVFLGGTCNNSNWRKDLIKKLKIDYFNPVVDSWDKEAYKKELIERKCCDFVLYTITPKMKGVYSIAEVVDDSNKRPHKTLFCILKDDDGAVFNDAQYLSLDRVARMVKKNGAIVMYDLDAVASYLNKNGLKE